MLCTPDRLLVACEFGIFFISPKIAVAGSNTTIVGGAYLGWGSFFLGFE
jgi:hypothetical protein